MRETYEQDSAQEQVLWDLLPGEHLSDDVVPAELGALHLIELTTPAGDRGSVDALDGRAGDPYDRTVIWGGEHVADVGPFEYETPPMQPHDVMARLARERQRLMRLRSGLLAELALRVNDTPVEGHHPADWASDNAEREVDESLLAAVRAELDEVAAAERRLADGRYGRCERCRATIPAERLRAEPATRWCVTHRLEAADGRV